MLTVRPQLGKILKERDMTQTQLADLSDIPQAAVSRFDKNTQHSDIHLFKIARALGIKVDDLFEVENVEETKRDEG